MTMAERKLPMGAKEIVASYRTARNPKAQIGVLADLNGCSQKEIEEVLIQLGAMKPTERKKPNPRKIDVDAAAARELLEQGMTDEEAASALGVGTHKFAEWRRERAIRYALRCPAGDGGARHGRQGTVRKRGDGRRARRALCDRGQAP